MADSDKRTESERSYREAEERFDGQAELVAEETEGELDDNPALAGDDGVAPTPAAAAAPSPAPATSAAPAAGRSDSAAAERELEAVGRRRARTVYDWLGFIGGVFALALGITMLALGTPEAMRFGADFYTESYGAMAQIAVILKVGFFGLLVSGGLGLMGAFGPRLMDRERRR